MKFSIQFPADLVTFTVEILNDKTSFEFVADAYMSYSSLTRVLYK